MRRFLQTGVFAVVFAFVFLAASSVQRGQAATSTPQHAEYILAAIPGGGGVSSYVTIPQTNTPLRINAAVTGGAPRGICAVNAVYVSSAPATFSWTGLGPGSANPAILVGGSTTVTGTAIAPLTAVGDVVLRIGTALNRVEVLNSTGAPVSVTLEFVW